MSPKVFLKALFPLLSKLNKREGNTSPFKAKDALMISYLTGMSIMSKYPIKRRKTKVLVNSKTLMEPKYLFQFLAVRVEILANFGAKIQAMRY